MTVQPIEKSSVSAQPGFAGKIWIDSAQITEVVTDADGKRRIRSGIVSGWAIGPDPFQSIEVILEGRRIASAKVGRYRPDVAEIYPSIPHAEYTGFEAILTGGELPEGPCQIILMAVGTSGKVFVKRFPLDGAEGEAAPSSMAMRTHVERCEIDGSGMLCIAGWAVAQAPIISVQIFGNGRKIAGTLPGLQRPDVAELFPQYPNADRSGFFVTASLQMAEPARDGTITIEVLARDGTLRRVVTTPQQVRQITLAPDVARTDVPAAQAPLPVTEPDTPAEPEDMWFFCDVIDIDTSGRCQISGWSAALAGIEALSLHYGGAEIGHALTGQPRPDVGRAYPNLPNAANSGFSFDLTHHAGLPEGPASFMVMAALKDGSRRAFEVSAMIVPPSARVSPFEDIVLGLDTFQLDAGHATRPVTGAFKLSGWAVARAGVRQIEVFLDGTSLGLAYIGIRREELPEIFFDFPDTLLAGFALSVPARVLKNGRSEVRIVITDRKSGVLENCFTIDVTRDAAELGRNALRQKVPFAEVLTGLDILAARGPMPVCDIVLRADTRPRLAERVQATLRSLGRQVYPHWRLWVNAPEGIAPEDLTRDLPQLADRVAPLADHAASDASGFVLMLRAGDVLSADGLLGPLLAVDTTGAPAFVYADDRRPDPLAPGEIAAFHKPGWSPDLLMSQNYIGRAWLASAALLRAAGFTLSDLAGLGEYGAVLRLSAMAARLGAIRQVPILMLETSTIETPAVERKALQAHLRSEGGMGRVRQGAAPFLHRIERTATSGGKVSIIIPSIGARDHILRCIDSIRKHSGGAEVEIVVVDNIRRRKITAEGRAWKAWFRAHADVVVEVDEPFNWSRLNNLGAAAASGDYLLFLNDDVEVLHADWLDVLMAEAARPEVGVVGAQLLYPDGKVQHAGMFLSRAMPGSARHAFRFAAADDPCYFGLALSQRELTCVTGACMMVRREVFDAVAGFDEAHAVVNNDIDFCLRLRATGRSVIFTPHARLLHHELASRAHLKDDFDRSAFLQTWGDLCLAGDPYVSPSISTEADDFAPEEEPLREVYPGHPLGAADQIRRILVVKLDHIGDLVTALPAIRQLKAQFPKAHLSALVGRSALGIASMEDAIDELIPFEFFDARSGLGRKKLTRADYAALERDLTARQFDLAVDLRKHADTRHILQISGAPLTAGFDIDREFPWLDIALGWERDTIQADKRNHVATDLMNLIGAIGSAFATSRRTIVTASDRLPPLSEALRTEFAGLFARDYVVIHPAAGTPLRQWPPEYFARLIDLLVEQDGVNVALIGGPDEVDIAANILDRLHNRDGVFNLVGRSKLAEVPRIMAESVLFVGNNSGPSHIASGLGVPTVAVHSALVSSDEWGPLGPSAVALRRDMSCAPCYIALAEQCHRNLACLQSLSPFDVHRLCQRFLALRRGGGIG